jgi:hypothetical protein
MERHKRVYAIGLALALTGAAGAQQAFKEGWMLEEHEASGINDLFLYWYDPETTRRWSRSPARKAGPMSWSPPIWTSPRVPRRPNWCWPMARRNTPWRSSVARWAGAIQWAESPASPPDLVELLTGQFTVLVDGIEIGRYSAKGAAESFERMIGACPMG